MLELTGLAPAKVNLVLEVLGRRSDGFHEIDTILQALDLVDRVSITVGDGPGVAVTGPAAAGVPADASNIAWRAAAELARLADEEANELSIRIHKVIPAAGGLGGGSSDAATVLRLLSHAWRTATPDLVRRAAASVGSDVAFFLEGSTARAQGRGERVTELEPLPRHGVVLFVPPDSLENKTAALFAALGRTPFDTGERMRTFLASHPARQQVGLLYNAFERVAFEQFSGLGALRDQIEARIGGPVRLAGAGPTLFWIGAPDDASEVAGRAAGLDCQVIPTATRQPAA